MEQKKNLCAQIPVSLHSRVREEQERTGKSLSEYIEMVLTQYYSEKGGYHMNGQTRTLAFQIPEKFFQRIKAHLERETARTGKKLTQREFILGLIETALD